MPASVQICSVRNWERWGPPSQRQVVALGRQRLAVQRLEERQKKLQQQTALVRAELYRAGNFCER